MADADGSFVTLIEKYGAEYLTWLMLMITSPGKIVIKTNDVKNSSRQSKYLLVIISVSIFIGATLGALIPNRPELKHRIEIFFVVSLLWLFLSFLVHYSCRLIGGKGNIQIGMSLMMQNLAFTYVASNFLTFTLLSVEGVYHPIMSFAHKFGILQTPGEILFGWQFLILLYLVPSTISYAHEFKGVRWFIVAVFSACFAIFFGYPVFALGGC
ncbi:MAG TPA: hypothetical protein VI298_13830 [Geobacteraceae bacterium]